MHPGGNFLFVARDTAGGIGVFAIDGSTGQLTPGATTTGGAAWRLALDASGRHVFELDASGGNVGTGAVRSYLFDAATGGLSYGGVTGTGVNPGSIAAHPSGRFVYVGNYGMPTPGTGWIPNGSISVIGVDASSGNFTSNAETTSGRASACMAADPAGRFLYFQNRGTDTTFAFVVTQYAIDPTTGALTVAQPDRAEGGCPTLW
jgi:6-phosphogluconolactonase (cycloisomerase 2 family)